MLRELAAPIGAVLVAIGVFLADWFLLPGTSVPAVFYAIPIAIVGFLAAPRLVAATSAFVVALEIASGLNDRILAWRLAADVGSLALIGILGVALAARMRQSMTLTREVDAERARLTAILAQMPSGLVVGEAPSGRIVLRNERVESIWRRPFEVPRAAEEYQNYYRLFHSDGRLYETEEYPLTRSLRGGETVVDEEATFERGDATRGTLRINSAPVYGPDRRIEAAVAIFEDITERKEAEQFREQYIHTVSHDLRAPLTIAMGQAQLLLRALQESHAESRELRSAEAIVTAGQRMKLMIQDLVDSARMESGQLRLEVHPTDLRDFVIDLLDRAAPLIDTRRVKVDVADDLPPALADASRLERILVNLLSNALKYSDPKTDVRVTARRVDGRDEVSVIDQGAGISDKDLPHIFDRFYRAEGGGTEGLGLGLYITKMLVEAHGGSIWAESRKGKGSSFSFSLPVAAGSRQS